MQVTVFESQVLEALAALVPEHQPVGMWRGRGSSLIAYHGKDLFGPDWGGRGIARKEAQYWERFPRIDLALGILRDRGLVEICEDDFIQKANAESAYAMRLWQLTDQGRELVGQSIG